MPIPSHLDAPDEILAALGYSEPEVGQTYESLLAFKIAATTSFLKNGVEPAVEAHGRGKKFVLRCRLRKDSRPNWTGTGDACQYAVTADASPAHPDRLEVLQIVARHTCPKRVRRSRHDASPQSTKSGPGYTRHKLSALLDELRLEREARQDPRQSAAPQSAAASPAASSSASSASSSDSETSSSSGSGAGSRPTRSCAQGIKYNFQPPLYKSDPSTSTTQKRRVQGFDPLGERRGDKKKPKARGPIRRTQSVEAEPQPQEVRPTLSKPVWKPSAGARSQDPGSELPLSAVQQHLLGTAIGRAGVHGPADLALLAGLDDATLSRFSEEVAKHETGWHATDRFQSIAGALVAFVARVRDGISSG